MTGFPITRSQAGLLALASFLATSIALFSTRVQWLGSWGETGHAWELTTVLTYPLVAGIAGWIAGAPRRWHFDAWMLTSGRPALDLMFRGWACLVVLSCAGFVAAASGSAILTAREATFGDPPLLTLVAVCAGFSAAVGIGVLLGRLGPPTFAAPLALIAVFAIVYLADPGNASLRPLAGLVVADQRERTYSETIPWVLTLRSAWLLVVAALAVALSVGRTRAWLVPFGFSCLLATPLLLVGDSGLRPTPGAAAPECEQLDASARVCMTRARAHELKEVKAAIRPVSRLLEGLSSDEDTYVEEGMADIPSAERASSRVIAFGIVNGVHGDAHQVDPRSLQAQIIHQQVLGNCAASDGALTEASGISRATPSDVIAAWAFSELDIPLDGSGFYETPVLTETGLDWSTVADFRRDWRQASPEQRRGWLASNRDAVQSCEPTASMGLP